MSATETALSVKSKEFESSLASLASRSSALVITDADSCRTGKELQKEWKSYIDRIGFELDPGISKAKELHEHLRDQKKKFTDPAKVQLDAVRQRVDAYTEKERLLAEQERQREQAKIDAEARRVAEEQRREAERVAAEQRKIAEAQAAESRRLREKELELQRKQGEINKRELEQAKKLEAEIAAKAKAQAAADEAKAKELAARQAEEAAKNTPQIQVKPNIPTVAGVKSQVYYFAEPVKSSLVLLDYDRAIRTGDKDRAAFLSQFVMVDEQAVSAFARKIKNNEKAADQVPGFRFWSKG